MAREIIQYRYDDSGQSNISLQDLTQGEFFSRFNILQLGIQAASGVRFYLNGDTSSQGIVIGSTGIYEVNVDGMTVITNLQFDKNTLTAAHRIIIDIVYEVQEDGH